jgi:phosphatidylserine/phosphatidylglycerophosphate/cardiolipin synthase-like enzyme
MDNDSWNALAGKIAEIARSFPHELVSAVLPRLMTWDNAKPELSRAKALVNIHNPQVRADFGALFDLWQRRCPEIPGSALALALQSSLALHQQQDQMQVDLTWTGPETDAIPLRRTDGALLQLIGAASESLLIVSFAVYKIQIVAEALQSAIERGVRLKIVLEQPDQSKGNLIFSGMPAFGREVLQRSEIYTWPLEVRPISSNGKHGSLHAKIALADRRLLFISSANLTEYAMNLNMEMGVLIQGGELPEQVGQHFEELIHNNILEPL